MFEWVYFFESSFHLQVGHGSYLPNNLQNHHQELRMCDNLRKRLQLQFFRFQNWMFESVNFFESSFHLPGIPICCAPNNLQNHYQEEHRYDILQKRLQLQFFQFQDSKFEWVQCEKKSFHLRVGHSYYLPNNLQTHRQELRKCADTLLQWLQQFFQFQDLMFESVYFFESSFHLRVGHDYYAPNK